MSNIIKKRRVITSGTSSSSSGGGTDPADKIRLTNLENNEYKLTYWQAISSSSGSVSKPTGSTIILDSFMEGIDALVETISNGEPTGLSPVDAGNNYVAVTSFDTSGNYTLSSIPTSYPVALIFIITIKAVDYVNVNNLFVITSEPNKLAKSSVADINVGIETSKYVAPLELESSKYLSSTMTKITTTSSGTNTYTATLSPAITAYNGIGIYVNFSNANTVNNPTLSLNGLSADGFIQSDGSNISIGALKGIVHLKHNGSAWQVLGKPVGTTSDTVAAGNQSMAVKSILSSTSIITNTGDTNENLKYASGNIVGLIEANDTFYISAMILATSSNTNNKTFRIYISDSQVALVNSLLVGTVTVTNNAGSSSLVQKFVQIRGSLSGANNVGYQTSSSTSFSSGNLSFSTKDLSTGSKYFVITMQNAVSSDSLQIQALWTQQFRP